MNGRLPSGHPRLDAVLGGGLPAPAITVVAGLPGTGKTILAQQYVFANATPERPAVYVSTVSEPFDKIVRFGQTLSFFDPKAVGRSVFYEDCAPALDADGLAGLTDWLDALLKRRRPGLLVVDSFKALHAYARDTGAFRAFLHELAGRLTALPVSVFWVGEYDPAELATEPEFAVADAILRLSTSVRGERETRVFQVLKLRGSGYLSGLHGYRLSTAGVEVFPRLADVTVANDYHLSDRRTSSGIPELDDMMGGGYWPGTSTLVAGPSGAGKTVTGLHFVFAGLDAGEPGLIATFQENPTQLQRTAAGFGWSLERPDVDVLYRAPIDTYVDQFVYELLDRVDAAGTHRVLIDSIGDLQFAADDEARFRELLYSLVQRCARQGVSVLMTLEVPDFFGITRLSDSGVSHFSDNVLLLQYLRGESQIKRALTVLKTRASLHQPQVRQFTITGVGLTLGEGFSPGQDLT